MIKTTSLMAGAALALALTTPSFAADPTKAAQSGTFTDSKAGVASTSTGTVANTGSVTTPGAALNPAVEANVADEKNLAASVAPEDVIVGNPKAGKKWLRMGKNKKARVSVEARERAITNELNARALGEVRG